jgi:hypothetical protein
MPDETPVLRVPYELFVCQGPCIYEAGLVSYHYKTGVHTARVRHDVLNHCRVGDRVLVQYGRPEHHPNEWWLFEVEQVDGDDAD